MTEHERRPSHNPPAVSMDGVSPSIGFPAVERLIESQRVLYVELDALSQRQADLIERGETDELLSVLGLRQRVLERVQSLHDAIAPVRANWRRFLETLSEPQRASLGVRVDEIARLIEVITQRDQSDKRRMIEGRDRLAAELSGVGKARAATGAYGIPSASGRAIYQDREA